MPIEYNYDRRETAKYRVLEYFRKRQDVWETLPDYIKKANAPWWTSQSPLAEKAKNLAEQYDYGPTKTLLKSDIEILRELVKKYRGKSAASEFSELLALAKEIMEELV